MKALTLYAEPWRYAVLQAARSIKRELCFTGPFSSVKLKEISEPVPPSSEWVKLLKVT